MGTSDDNARWIGAGESSWRPCADCTVYLRQRAAHSLDGAPRLQLFFECLLQDLHSKHGIGIHLLELGVLFFKSLEALGISDLHHSVFLAPTMESCHRNLLLLTEVFLAQVSAVAFTQQQDDFFRLVSLLLIHFLGFGFHQILSLNMDHFLWRRPDHPFEGLEKGHRWSV